MVQRDIVGAERWLALELVLTPPGDRRSSLWHMAQDKYRFGDDWNELHTHAIREFVEYVLEQRGDAITLVEDRYVPVIARLRLELDRALAEVVEWKAKAQV
jgi:hypothetical protein